MTRVVQIVTVPMSLRFLRGQASYMRERGLDMHAISSPGRELDAFGAAEGVTVHTLRMSRAITPLRDFRCLISLVGLLRRLRPDIVHSNTPKAGLLGMLAAWWVGVPVRIYHLRGLRFETATGARRRLLRFVEVCACRAAHRVICVSHSLEQAAVAEQLCAPRKLGTLASGSGNGVDAAGRFDPARVGDGARSKIRAELGIPERATVVLFVGRVVRDKGCFELFEAWASIRGRYPEAHLVVMGPDEDGLLTRSGAAVSILEDERIHFTGMREPVAPFYAAADLLVLPTYREGFPNVLLEAGAMELPVVATRVTGCVDAVVDGETGTLVPPRDPVALARAIEAYLEDASLRRRHGTAARRRVLELYRPELVWEALYREYSELLRQRGVALPEAEVVAQAAHGGS